MENINSHEQSKDSQIESSDIQLFPFEKKKITEITLGIESTVDKEVIETALEDVISTLENGHPLNTLIMNSENEISGYLACEDFEDKIAYLKYMASNESGEISLFKEVSKILNKAESLDYEKINFHGWNNDLNSILERRYGFKKVRTDNMNGQNVGFYEKNLQKQQSPNEQQIESYANKNLLRIQKLLQSTLEKINDERKVSDIDQAFKNIDARISRQLGTYTELEQVILHLKIARYFQKNESLDESVLIDALLETPKFIQKDKGSLERLFEIHEQKTIMKIAEIRKSRAEMTGEESFNPYESLLESESGDYYIARLLNMPHLEEESDYMKHCVGTSDSYISKMKANEVDILSIRNTPKIDPETNSLTIDTPLITIEYNRKTKLIEQMKKYDDEYLSPDDPYYSDTLELLDGLHTQTLDPTRSYEISSIANSETENIEVPKGHILLNTGLIPLHEYNTQERKESFIIKCENPEISENTTKEEFAIYASIPNIEITIQNRELAQKFLDGSTKSIAGNLNLESLTSAEGLVLPESVGGYLNLESLTSAEGLVLPESVGGNLRLYSLASAEGLVLPKSVGGYLNLISLANAEGLVLPESVGGNLNLGSLASAEGLVLPKSVGGYLNSRSLTEKWKESLRERYPQHAEKIR